MEKRREKCMDVRELKHDQSIYLMSMMQNNHNCF